MSDETRTVTRKQLADALVRLKFSGDLAPALFAALPTSTEGLDRNNLAKAICAVRDPEVHGDLIAFVDDECRSWANRAAAEYARLASLSPSPTETPE